MFEEGSEKRAGHRPIRLGPLRSSLRAVGAVGSDRAETPRIDSARSDLAGSGRQGRLSRRCSFPPPCVRKKHRSSLDAIYRKPVPADLSWDDVVSLIEAVGGKVTNSGGSARIVEINGGVNVFHEPHGPQMGRGMVRRVRSILERAGVRPV